ncbi:MAG: CopD family protein [Pseudomonadota bacterium]
MDFLSAHAQWIKVGHLAAVIAWMAAMLYLPRLFVYHHQAKPGGEAEDFFIKMQGRLLKGIMTPAMLATWVFAILLMVANTTVFSSGWFYVKLASVVAITGIHGFYASARKKFLAGQRPQTEKFWRMINEVPFVLMFVVLIMVLVKPF